MKQITLENGNWIEKVSITITEEQKALLKTNNEENKVERDTLRLQIQNDSNLIITDQELIDSFQKKYDKVKPVLKVEDLENNIQADEYQFISFDITVNDGKILSGILNCRINGEHKQVRF